MTSPASRRRAFTNALKLTAVMVAAWGVAAAVAWSTSGPRGLLQASLAAALCLTPGWLVFTFAGLYGTAAPLGTVIVGAVARMAAALVGALAVKAVRPDLGNLSFAVWLGVFYAVALTTETALLLKPSELSKPQSRGPSSED